MHEAAKKIIVWHRHFDPLIFILDWLTGGIWLFGCNEQKAYLKESYLEHKEDSLVFL